jgi:hypothetical protein
LYLSAGHSVGRVSKVDIRLELAGVGRGVDDADIVSCDVVVGGRLGVQGVTGFEIGRINVQGAATGPGRDLRRAEIHCSEIVLEADCRHSRDEGPLGVQERARWQVELHLLVTDVGANRCAGSDVVVKVRTINPDVVIQVENHLPKQVSGVRDGGRYQDVVRRCARVEGNIYRIGRGRGRCVDENGKSDKLCRIGGEDAKVNDLRSALNGGDIWRLGRPVQGVPKSEKNDSSSGEERHKPLPLGYLADNNSHNIATGLAGGLAHPLLGLPRYDLSLRGALGSAALPPGRFMPLPSSPQRLAPADHPVTPSGTATCPVFQLSVLMRIRR